MKPTLSYVICTTPRSGSWMLCSILRQTGHAGRPGEHFGPTLNEEFNSNRHAVHAADVREYVEKAVVVGIGANGVFGTKLLASMTPVFMQRASEHAKKPFYSLRIALEETFTDLHYVRLIRKNRVAQAISYYRALRTQLWVTATGAASAQALSLEYDHFGIQRCYQHVADSESYWDGYFKTHGIEPLTIYYEDILSNRESVLREVFQEIGLSRDLPVPEARTAKLSGEESRVWEEEFRRSGWIPDDAIARQMHIWAPY
ncbi:MAG: Stf0 family sulfotransferase [bacterium]|nr:Stf0 family sulfotransferase [bacterium]